MARNAAHDRETTTQLVAELAADSRSSLRGRIMAIVASVVVVTALVIIWVATPLREWVDVPNLVALLGRFGESPLAPLVLLGLYVAGGLVLVPVNVLIAVTMLVFGPARGVAYGLIGSVLSALVVYEIGRRIPAAEIRRRFDSPLQKLRALMVRRGVLAIALVRIVPIAPYSIVNLVAGAAHVRRMTYLIGTTLGMLPGIIVNALFVDRVVAAISNPHPATLALLAAVVFLIAAVVLLLKRAAVKSAPSS